MHIVHVITGLTTGGAETMLWRLLQALQARSDLTHTVVCLQPLGTMAARIHALGVPLYALGMDSLAAAPLKLAQLVRLLRRLQPSLVQTWMYHGDLLGGLAAWQAGGLPVVWGIHNSTLAPSQTGRATRLVVQANSALSHWLPVKIISCSQRARQVHEHAGYDPDRFVVIPNGFDTESFRPSVTAHDALTARLSLPSDALHVGLVARFHPQKDVQNFVRGAALARQRVPAARFVLCGDGMSTDNRELMGWIAASEVRECFHLLGRQENVAAISAGLDLAVLSSAFGEAFPLVLGEAMACAVPCVATDVGDSALLVGDTGRIVPPRDSAALGEAIVELLGLSPAERTALGARARQRIVANFSLARMAEAYARVYARVYAVVKQISGERR